LFKTGQTPAVDTVRMGEPTFTPAAGRFAPTRFYDPVVVSRHGRET
jgi:hypothetical protein